jgi:hypothetical protein
MKFLFVVLAMTGTSVLANAQHHASAAKTVDDSVSPVVVKKSNNIQHNINPPGLRMRNTGRTLTIIGGVVLVSGIIRAATADELYYETTYSSSGTYSEGDPQGAIGIVMAVAGTGMAIPGIIFWSKGSKRYNKYLEEQRASLSLKGTGLTLRYQF